MSRQEDNQAIAGVLILAIKQNPQQRFEQLLFNMGITDTNKDYNLESSYTLDKVFASVTRNKLVEFKEMEQDNE